MAFSLLKSHPTTPSDGGIPMITFEQITGARDILHHLILTKWLTQDLFSTRWWGIVAFIVFSYILVFSLLDKKRSTQILLFGALMTVSIVTYDLAGANFGLWGYKIRLFPLIPGVFLYDYTLIPLYYMLVYQYSPDWKSFFLWNAVLAGTIGFLFFPGLVALDIIQFKNWLPGYQTAAPFAFALLNRAVVLKTLQLEKSKAVAAPSIVRRLSPQPARKPLKPREHRENRKE